MKDPKTIALLVKDGRYSTSYLPSGVYAEIREVSVCRDQIMKQHVRLSNQIQGWFQKFFPEYFECYADWDSTSGLMLLKEAPLPQDILKLGAGGINQIWRNDKVRAAGIKRAQTLVEAAQGSVGLSTVIGFVAEVGDIGRFTDPKQIQKLAGLEIWKICLFRKYGIR